MNENENSCSKKRKMLANNVIFISLPKIATTSYAEWDTCVADTPVRAATPTPTTSLTPAAQTGLR